MTRFQKSSAQATRRHHQNKPSARVLAMLNAPKGHSVADCRDSQCRECRDWYADKKADEQYRDSIGER